MFEEYKDITVGKLNQEIERLSKLLPVVTNDQERKDIQARLDYLNQLDRTGIKDWKAEKKEDTAEGIIANNPTSQERIENAPNSLTEGQKKGNRGDNKVAMKYDPSYWDAKSTEQVKEEQINNVDKTPPEEPADKGDFTLGGSMEGKEFVGGPKPETKLKTEGNKEKQEDGKEDKDPESKGRYKSSMYGILDAMRNGDIDKSTGLYFMLDALSKAARNTGIDIGNIGAQFTGGTVRNDYQDSLWNQRKDKMFANAISSELNQQSGTDAEMDYKLKEQNLIGQGFANEQANLMLDASRKLKDSANKFREEGNETLAGLYDVISSGAASGKIDVEEIAGIVAAGVLDTPEGKAASKEIVELLSTLGQTVNTTLGSVNSAANSFSNGVNQVMSLFTGNK